MRKNNMMKRISLVILSILLIMTSMPQGLGVYAGELNEEAVQNTIQDDYAGDAEEDVSFDASSSDESDVNSETETGADEDGEGDNGDCETGIDAEGDNGDRETRIDAEGDENCRTDDRTLGQDDPEWVKGQWQQNFNMSQALSFESIQSEDLAIYSYGNLDKYKHGKYATNYYIRKGIDVSRHQGTIDWNKVKADGVEFAFIRVAFRGYGASGSLNTDDKYVTNIKGAQAAGIPVGVYIFSQATTVAEAQAEADYALKCVKGYTIQLPVIMDFEYASTDSGTGGRLYNANLSKAQATSICNAFCKRVKDAGYEPMVYANKDMLTNHLNAAQISDNYKIWIARWNTETGYLGDYSYWQFSDKGSVNGITGAVDLDFGYELIEDEPDTDRYVSDVYAASFDERTQITDKLAEGISTTVNPGTEITLASETANTAIYYTTGTTVANTPKPTRENGTRYTEPIKITSPTVIKAIAMKSQFKDSGVTTFILGVNDLSLDQGDVADEDMPEGNTQEEKLSKISDFIWTSKIEDQIYTGKAIIPSLRVYAGKKLLIEKTDYSLVYRNNVNSGTASVTIVGRGSYTGSYQTTFNILTRDLSDAVNEITPISVPYNKKNQAPSFSVTVDGRKLIQNRDYTISIVRKSGEEEITVTNCKDVGTYIYTVTAKENGNYHGSGSFSFTIRESAISLSTARISVDNQNFAEWMDYGADPEDDSDDCLTDPQDPARSFPLTGSDGGIRPVIKVIDSKGNEIPVSEYDISYINNTVPGLATVKITAKNDSLYYTGTQSKYFRITGYSIAKASVLYTDRSTGITQDISRGMTLIYNGNEQEPLGSTLEVNDIPDNIDISFTVKRGETPLKLKKGRDFTVSYLNNIKVGTATVVLTGKGGFTGVLRKQIRIQEYVASSSDELKNHILVQFLNPDKSENLVDKKNGKTRYVPEYEYIKGGVTPQIKVYYETESIVTPLTTEPSLDAIELVAGTDYTIRHIRNTTANSFDVVNSSNISIAPQVVITGKRSFKGTFNVTYTILPKDISQMSITAADKTCNGKAGQYKVTPVLTDSSSSNMQRLVAGVDYEKNPVYTLAEANYVRKYDSAYNCSYKRWISAGTVLNPNTDIIIDNTAIRVTVSGKGNYTGTISTVYRMNNLNISAATVKVADQNYLGKAVRPGKSDIISITMKVNGKVRTLNPEDYEITSYQRNTGRGTGIMTIHGLGDYCGYKNVSFRINARSIFYIIEYKANSSSATGVMANQNVFFKGTKLVTLRYRNTGYEFEGWNTEADGSGDSFANAQVLEVIYPGAKLTLYAQWKKAE